MHKEIEVKVLNIDIAEMRRKIKKLGGKKIFGPRLIHDVIFKNSMQKKRYALFRLRKEGNTACITLKVARKGRGVKARNEHEVGVYDFDAVLEILTILGFEILRNMEKMREEYSFGGAKIEIDIYPGMSPYLEIEGKSKGEIQKILKLLDIPWSRSTDKTAPDVIREAGLNPNEIVFKNKK